MIRLYIITTLIILCILTVSISIIRPEINKPVKFANESFQITTELASNPNATNEIQESKIKITNTDLAEQKTIEKQNATVPKIVTKTQVVENKSNNITKVITPQKKETVKKITKDVKITPPKNTTKQIETSANNQKTVEQIQTKLPQSVKEIVTDSPKPPKVVLPKIEGSQSQEILSQTSTDSRPLTEQEEIIIWNIWRSNLQNKIMEDTQINAPLGTAFKFSFTVDRNGRISNLRTWAIPSAYNGVAINYLKPLILSYQGQSILNFPARTKRIITNVTGGFVISTEDKFSTPNDFSDIEKIKTLR